MPKSILEIPKHGCINVHASYLPRWRGAAPIQHAIIAGDADTGVSIMQMDIGLDTGDVLAAEKCAIHESDDFKILHDRIAELGCTTLLETLGHIEHHSLQPQPQDDDAATYASKISKKDAEINWQEKAETIERKIIPSMEAYEYVGHNYLNIKPTANSSGILFEQ